MEIPDHDPVTKEALAIIVASEISEALEDFYNLAKPHTYLDGIGNGGLVLADTRAKADGQQHYTRINACALHEPEEGYLRIGFPAEALENGVWSVLYTDESFSDNPESDIQEDATRHIMAYWDGHQWIVCGMKADADISGDDWVSMWEPVEMTELDIAAIQVTVDQTYLVCRVADSFDNDENEDLESYLSAAGIDIPELDRARYRDSQDLRVTRYLPAVLDLYKLSRIAWSFMNEGGIEADSLGLPPMPGGDR